MKAHVCLVSDQPIPNLTTIFRFRPDNVVLLTTTEKRKAADRLTSVLGRKGFRVDVVPIEAYDMNSVISSCETIISKYADHELSLNITGGTKIGTLGAFQVFYTEGLPIYYVDTHDDRIIQVSPEEETFPIVARLPIKDYLEAYGFKITRMVKDDSYIKRRWQLTEYLKDLAIKDPRAIGCLNGLMPSDTRKAVYPYRCNAEPRLKDLFLLLLKEGFVVPGPGGSVIIPDEDIASYLKGLWFEEYVYTIARDLDVDDVRLNVEGKWDVKSEHTPMNEFDVLVARKNRLYYISCKTVNPDRIKNGTDKPVTNEYLYELDALGDMAFGIFGKRMLASARPILSRYIKERARFMGIKIVDGRQIATLKENLRQWLTK